MTRAGQAHSAPSPAVEDRFTVRVPRPPEVARWSDVSSMDLLSEILEHFEDRAQWTIEPVAHAGLVGWTASRRRGSVGHHLDLTLAPGEAPSPPPLLAFQLDVATVESGELGARARGRMALWGVGFAVVWALVAAALVGLLSPAIGVVLAVVTGLFLGFVTAGATLGYLASRVYKRGLPQMLQEFIASKIAGGFRDSGFKVEIGAETRAAHRDLVEALRRGLSGHVWSQDT